MDLDIAIQDFGEDVEKVAQACNVAADVVENRLKTFDVYKKQLEYLLTIPKIEQKSPEWYEARHCCISASDLAQALGEGKFGTVRDLIIKKVDPPEYGGLSNPFFQWGNMFEQVASDVYAKMHKVHIHEFGLIRHPRVNIFAASPDGITEKGIMIEIKCPLKRKVGGEIPTQYYYQIQGQLDVCDLDECDYFECEFVLCKSIWEFEASNDVKGVFSKNANGTYDYGPLVLTKNESMTEIEEFANTHPSIHYWTLKKYSEKRVYKDQAFIDEKLHELREVWNKVLYYRENRDKFITEILQELTIETEPISVPLKAYAFID